jgi:hypothetical protein
LKREEEDVESEKKLEEVKYHQIIVAESIQTQRAGNNVSNDCKERREEKEAQPKKGSMKKKTIQLMYVTIFADSILLPSE